MRADQRQSATALLLLLLLAFPAYALDGVGPAVLEIVVQPNYGPERVGTVTIAGITYTVTQASGCAITLAPTLANFGTGAGSGSISVTASDPACPWQTRTNVDWITINAGGLGNGRISYSVQKNVGNSPARTGTITVAGQTFVVSQAGRK